MEAFWVLDSLPINFHSATYSPHIVIDSASQKIQASINPSLL